MANQGAHIVRQKTMKAHMSEAQLIMTTPQLRLPICPQRHRRMIAADRMSQKCESLDLGPEKSQLNVASILAGISFLTFELQLFP